jgi:D-hexose-6-phosphate mutarotase
MKLTESTITLLMQKNLEELIETKITHTLGGRRAEANIDKKIRLATMITFLRDFYAYFNISGYSQIRINQLDSVNKYILNWNAPNNLALTIKDINKKNEVKSNGR